MNGTNGRSDFIGTGWAYPVRVNARGGLALASGAEEIAGSLRMILETAPGERVMRPEFGCRIWELLFDPVNPNVLGLMAQAVRDAIRQWEPRVDLEKVTANPHPDDGARVDIEMTYRVKTTNDLRNLVFPFYVIPREEER